MANGTPAIALLGAETSRCVTGPNALYPLNVVRADVDGPVAVPTFATMVFPRPADPVIVTPLYFVSTRFVLPGVMDVEPNVPVEASMVPESDDAVLDGVRAEVPRLKPHTRTTRVAPAAAVWFAAGQGSPGLAAMPLATTTRLTSNVFTSVSRSPAIAAVAGRAVSGSTAPPVSASPCHESAGMSPLPLPMEKMTWKVAELPAAMLSDGPAELSNRQLSTTPAPESNAVPVQPAGAAPQIAGSRNWLLGRLIWTEPIDWPAVLITATVAA